MPESEVGHPLSRAANAVRLGPCHPYCRPRGSADADAEAVALIFSVSFTIIIAATAGLA